MFALLFETQPLIISLIHPTKTIQQHNRSPDSTFGFTRDALLMIRHKQHTFSSILSETPAWATNTTPGTTTLPATATAPETASKTAPTAPRAATWTRMAPSSSLMATEIHQHCRLRSSETFHHWCFATTFRAPKPSGASASIGGRGESIFTHGPYPISLEQR